MKAISKFIEDVGRALEEHPVLWGLLCFVLYIIYEVAIK